MSEETAVSRMDSVETGKGKEGKDVERNWDRAMEIWASYMLQGSIYYSQVSKYYDSRISELSTMYTTMKVIVGRYPR